MTTIAPRVPGDPASARGAVGAARKPVRTIAPGDAARALYIDFEGEKIGRRCSSAAPGTSAGVPLRGSGRL